MSQFNERLYTTQDLGFAKGADNTAAGTLADVVNAGTSLIRFTNASQINSFVAGLSGKVLRISNASAGNIVIADETGATAANRIRTGTGANLTLAVNASIDLWYDPTATRWKAVGIPGSGGGGSSGFVVYTTESITAGGTISLSATDPFQLRPIQGSGGQVTASVTPFGTSAPLDGTEIVLYGVSDTLGVGLVSNDANYGLMLKGDTTLLKGDTLRVQWLSAVTRYIEIARNK